LGTIQTGNNLMKRCPKCKVYSEDEIDFCDCGYRFSTNTIESQIKSSSKVRKEDDEISGAWNIHHVILAFFLASGGYQIMQSTPGASPSRYIAFVTLWMLGYTISKILVKKLMRFSFVKFSPFIFGTALAIGYLIIGCTFLVFAWALNFTTNH